MSLLIDLGKYLFLSVSKEWLDLENVSRLDTSMCSTAHRSLLLDYLSSLDGTFEVFKEYLACRSFTAWVSQRNLNIDSMIFHNATFGQDGPRINVKALKTLQMSHCWKENEVILNQLIGAMGNSLKRVAFTRTIYITQNLISHLAHHCPNITSCNFEHLYNLTNEGVVKLSEKCRLLNTINLSYCGNISDPSIHALCLNCPDLTSINVSNCQNITDEAVYTLAKHVPDLLSLNLSYCDQITEGALKVLFQQCSNITDLSLDFCKKAVNDQTLKQMGLNLKKLLHISISYSNTITDSGIDYLAQHCSNITSINIRWLDKITLKSIASIGKYLPNLRKIQFENTLGYGNDKPFLLIVNNMKNVTLFDFSNGTIEGIPYTSLEEKAADPAVVHDINIDEPFVYARLKNNASFEKAFSKCTTLSSFTVCGTVSPDVLYKIPYVFRNLIKLNLEFGKLHVCDEHLTLFASQCVQIECFSVQKCSLVTDVGVMAIVTACRNMLRLNIGHCTQVTDLSVMAIATYNPKLRYLNIARCKLTEASIVALAHRCLRLDYLDLTGYVFESTKAIRMLVQNCVYLTDLVLSRSAALTSELTEDFLEKYGIDFNAFYDNGADERGSTAEENDSDSDLDSVDEDEEEEGEDEEEEGDEDNSDHSENSYISGSPAGGTENSDVHLDESEFENEDAGGGNNDDAENDEKNTGINSEATICAADDFYADLFEM